MPPVENSNHETDSKNLTGQELIQENIELRQALEFLKNTLDEKQSNRPNLTHVKTR